MLPRRPLYAMMAEAIEQGDPAFIEDTLTILAKLRDIEPDRREKRFIQGLLSRLLTVRDVVTGQGIVLRG